jgi:hypothetical protein
MATKYRGIINRIDEVTGEGQGNFVRRKKNDDTVANKIHHNAGGSGKCASCGHCVIPPRSKWSAKIGLCHGRGPRAIVVSLNSTCRFRVPAAPSKMKFERRQRGFRTPSKHKAAVWRGVMAKDELLNELLEQKQEYEQEFPEEDEE